MKSNEFIEDTDEKIALDLEIPFPLGVTEKLLTKRENILWACKSNCLQAVRDLATTEGGLVTDSLRRKAWPLLLGLKTDGNEVQKEDLNNISWKDLPPHPDEDQVKLDVNRSFIYYPIGLSSKELQLRKEQLSDLIIEILRRSPYLSYFQGYHDICQVFMLVLDSKICAPAISRLSILRIRDFMLPTFFHTLEQLLLIPSVLHSINPKLWKHLSTTKPYFALSATLTMFAHELQDYDEVTRLFDVLLAREAVFSIYMYAQIILQRSEELFRIPADEPDILHSTLSKLPRPLAIDNLIENTVKLLEKHPPESLKEWHSISSYSVLKTARWPDQILQHTLDDGAEFFRKQAREQRRAETTEMLRKMIWKYRKPVLTICISISVGFLAIWIRISLDKNYLSMIM
ncbi:unnamed protein product [Blumeria hordei]|uniref:Rab-GAP TBC domain-containing protein n=2 Tax=Blumeria hordei TaxID=2867405 RepID=A0A383ULG1_BLUHO|nr:TBC domain-containing protein/GTPase activating protein gyp10/gyp10 [Blumeria hordei DH14]SZF01123.1 unnamed protein product [Blumeria hordei]